jgi:DNA-binding transcriptional MerR regulator
MNDREPTGFLLAPDDGADKASRQAESEPVYTIGELAKKFGLSLRALRFYEVLGLLTPERQGHRRIYGREAVDRLAAILKAKRFGFTLSETKQMLADEASTLKLTRERCLEQIAFFERRIAEMKSVLAELRRIYTSL